MPKEFNKADLEDFLKGCEYEARTDVDIDGCDNQWYDCIYKDDAGRLWRLNMLNGNPAEIVLHPKGAELMYRLTEVEAVVVQRFEYADVEDVEPVCPDCGLIT